MRVALELLDGNNHRDEEKKVKKNIHIIVENRKLQSVEKSCAGCGFYREWVTNFDGNIDIKIQAAVDSVSEFLQFNSNKSHKLKIIEAEGNSRFNESVQCAG